MPKNKRVAAIDAGSNTFLLTIAEGPSIIYDQGFVVRLSEGVTPGSPLLLAAKQRALATLKQFADTCAAYDVQEIHAVGTAVWRKASDAKSFVDEIKNITGIEIKIIDGLEEARLSYLSARHDFSDETIGMIDIGGASTEIVSGDLANRVSLPIGSVALTEQFIANHPINDIEWNNLKKFIEQIIASEAPAYTNPITRFIALAATATSLKAIDLKMTEYDGNKIHGQTLSKTKLDKIIEQLRTLDLSERKKIPGLHPKRADVLPAGGLILSCLMDYFNIEQITISDHGLRHGLLQLNISC